jgi:ABC-type multidrug transport system fused ATPase/permease subunit
MKTNYSDISFITSLNKFFKVIRLEKKEVTAIYFYAILSGVIQLSLPLGIQTIINFSQAAAGTGSLPVSIIILITIVLIGILVSGILQVNQMKIVEKIEQSIFVRFSLDFAYRIPKIESTELNYNHLPELMNRFFEIITLQKGLSKILLDIPLAVIQIIFGLVLLSFYNSTFIVLGLLLILVLFFILKYTTKKGLIASYIESENKYEVASWLEEVARSYKTFKISSQNNFHLKKTDKFVKDYLISKTAQFDILKVQYWSLIVFKLLISALMLIIGAALLIKQELNIGQFIAAEIVILLILSAVEKLILNLEVIYNILTGIEKLNKMGVVFAKGPGEWTKYENSFAIFKKDMYVINSLKVFVDVLMNLDKHAIKPGEQVVWNWIPSFFNHLKCKKYGGVIYDNMNPDKEIHGDLKTLLFRVPYIRHYCDTRETILLKDFLKYVPVPRSKFTGGSKLRYRSLLTFGLAMLTIVAGFVPYRS